MLIVECGYRMKSEKESDASQSTLAERMLALNRVLLGAYLKGLTSDRPAVRRKAARGLANLGSIAQEAVPALERALKDPDVKVRQAAAWSLRHIGSSDR
jgi:HEAT repeat protein